MSSAIITKQNAKDKAFIGQRSVTSTVPNVDLSNYRTKDDLSYGENDSIALKSELGNYFSPSNLSYTDSQLTIPYVYHKFDITDQTITVNVNKPGLVVVYYQQRPYLFKYTDVTPAVFKYRGIIARWENKQISFYEDTSGYPPITTDSLVIYNLEDVTYTLSNNAINYIEINETVYWIDTYTGNQNTDLKLSSQSTDGELKVYNSSGDEVTNYTIVAVIKYKEEVQNYTLATKEWVRNYHQNPVIQGPQANTTVTHYCPYELTNKELQVGDPVFLTGHVFKQVNKEWIPSTETDTTDCICSVTANGDYKTFVGIVTDIDKQNRSLTFASHGDFLFRVTDSTQYFVGDTVLFDGSVLDEDYVHTLKLQRSIVGIVSAKINATTLAIFRS